MKKIYSIASIIKNSLSGNENGGKCGETPIQKTLRRNYCWGGGHGLGTAYYLAKHHGIKNIAVIEKGWLGVVILEEIPQL